MSYCRRTSTRRTDDTRIEESQLPLLKHTPAHRIHRFDGQLRRAESVVYIHL